MEIIWDADVEDTQFKYLAMGEIFKCNGTVYMKINISAEVLNSVDLSNGSTEVIRYDENVTKLEGKLILSRSRG